jgi:hypothetical protein
VHLYSTLTKDCDTTCYSLQYQKFAEPHQSVLKLHLTAQRSALSNRRVKVPTVVLRAQQDAMTPCKGCHAPMMLEPAFTTFNRAICASGLFVTVFSSIYSRRHGIRAGTKLAHCRSKFDLRNSPMISKLSFPRSFTVEGWDGKKKMLFPSQSDHFSTCKYKTMMTMRGLEQQKQL